MSATETGILERTIDLGEHGTVNGLWHCFGHRSPAVSVETVRDMLDASGTRLLPINTHTGRAVIGHGDVTWESFRDEAIERELVPCLNINLQTSAARAVAQAVRFRDETGISLLKLEVLNEDLATSNDTDCCIATYRLIGEGFTVMPLTSDTTYWCGARRPDRRVCDFAASWADQPIPLFRVMGSPIGSGRGIMRPDQIRTVVAGSTVPVILDGGIGTVSDARVALELGCAGFLVNSALFQPGPNSPADWLREYRMAFA